MRHESFVSTCVSAPTALPRVLLRAPEPRDRRTAASYDSSRQARRQRRRRRRGVAAAASAAYVTAAAAAAAAPQAALGRFGGLQAAMRRQK